MQQQKSAPVCSTDKIRRRDNVDCSDYSKLKENCQYTDCNRPTGTLLYNDTDCYNNIRATKQPGQGKDLNLTMLKTTTPLNNCFFYKISAQQDIVKYL